MTPGSIVRYFLIFTGLLLLQVVVIDPINLGRFATPFLYVLFVIILPVNIKPWRTLLICFVAGLAADFFSDTGAKHAFCMTLAAFVRTYFLPVFINKDDLEKAMEPNLFNMGYRLFTFYAAGLTFVYHLAFTLLDYFTFHYFFRSIAIAIASSLLGLVLILLIQLIFYRVRANEL